MRIYDLLDNLKQSLDKESSIINIKDIQLRIREDSNLMNMINNNDKTSDLLISEYRHLENEVNYIILYINSRLKDTFRSDKDESHTR